MRITFQLRFHTEYGQSLAVAGNHPALGNDLAETAIQLQYVDSEFWRAVVEFPDGLPSETVNYRYILTQKDGSKLEDWGNDRALPAVGVPGEVLIIDSWNDPGDPRNAFSTEPFKKVLLKNRRTELADVSVRQPTHEFKVKAPLLEPGQTLCLLGNAAELGNWDTKVPVLLNRTSGEDYFAARLDLRQAQFPVFYKYGVFDTVGGTFVRYEEGENRMLREGVAANKFVVANDGFAALPAANWRGAGVAIPVFSLRSDKSFGIGEFTDLKLLVDWCRRTGIRLIQILPVNDTTATHSWRDSYPYSAISAFALHPLYLSLDRIADDKKDIIAAEPERLRLNALESVDYAGVLKAKEPLLRALYGRQKQKTFASAAYRQFFEDNRHWLLPYAAFCYLRDEHRTADFTLWPAHRRYDAQDIDQLAKNNPGAEDALGFYYFVQFHLHSQLQETAEYAHANGVILNGDIPIGVFRHGADAWQDPEQYCMEMQAGAPPDPFSDKGQNWNFPTYNWARMRANGYDWWKQRFAQMGRYFDAFRIDHVLGFFRIWSIPAHAVEGILGYFVPAIPVQAGEFAARRMRFDRDRYVKPHITEAVLNEKFGAAKDRVKREFLRPGVQGQFELRAEFATQRQVEKHFEGLDQDEKNETLKLGLYDLISDVILLEPVNTQGHEFHFRFGIERTCSFRSLDGETQWKLRELYIDYFFRRQDAFWRKEGLQKLPALKRSTNMLVCGEDLGMVPASVPEVMKQLGLLSLEVQRMPKRLNQQFSRPQDAPYLSVVTPSTHDMSTLRGWWKEDRKVTQEFYNQELGEPGTAPPECEPWINRAIVAQHLASPAMWSIFQLQELLGMDALLRRANPDDERINVPGNTTFYWRYRMHLTLESLLSANEFNDQLQGMLAQAGRFQVRPSTAPPGGAI